MDGARAGRAPREHRALLRAHRGRQCLAGRERRRPRRRDGERPDPAKPGQPRLRRRLQPGRRPREGRAPRVPQQRRAGPRRLAPSARRDGRQAACRRGRPPVPEPGRLRAGGRSAPVRGRDDGQLRHRRRRHGPRRGSAACRGLRLGRVPARPAARLRRGRRIRSGLRLRVLRGRRPLPRARRPRLPHPVRAPLGGHACARVVRKSACRRRRHPGEPGALLPALGRRFVGCAVGRQYARLGSSPPATGR